jgi:hypothetical protein
MCFFCLSNFSIFLAHPVVVVLNDGWFGKPPPLQPPETSWIKPISPGGELHKFDYFLVGNLEKGRSPSWKPSVAATRVARWFIFEPKISIWLNFGGP